MVSTSIDINPKNTMVSTSIGTNPINIKKKTTGRKRIEIKKIEKNNSLQVTFSKRRTGLFKKASELCVLTGAQVTIFVKSSADRMYVSGQPHVDALIEKHLQEKNNDNVSLPMLPENGLNQSCEEYLREFEAENKLNETITSSGSNDDGLGSDECIDEMGLGELENHLCKLQEAKYDAEDRANELMLNSFFQELTPARCNEQKELGRDPTAAELFFWTHVKKDMKTFGDSEAKETWEKYMEKYEAEDNLDKKSGNIANIYIRWADHVGSKKGKFYGLPSGFDRYIFEHIVDSIGQTSQNYEMVQLREMLDCQKIQYDLLKAEQERMKTTQEAHTEKLDQVAKSQISLEDDLNLIQGATQKVLDLLQRRQPTV
nr:agamous-like MADS-box protein AGL62 [Tanacetum cinerariifolium]